MNVEVAVVGSGPAGCAAATAAARPGLSVALVDPILEGGSIGCDDGFDADRPEGNDGERAPRIGETAAPGTPQLIAEIFGHPTAAFTPDRHVISPGNISAWGSTETASTEHVYNPLGPAWNLNRECFDEDLRAGARHLGVVPVRARVVDLEFDRDIWTLVAKDSDERTGRVRAAVVVDATGRGARVGHLLAAKQRHLDRLVALWSMWSVDERDQRAATHVEATEGGWWYSTLLPERRRTAVHLTDVDLLPSSPSDRRALALSVRGLPLIGSLLDLSDRPMIVHGPRLAIARSSRLGPPAGPRWLAAGDAACTVDPLSGRGIVAALLSGRAAGQTAVSILSGHHPEEALGRYRVFVSELLLDGCRQQVDAYAAERRWPASPFWRRRHEVLGGRC